MNPFGGGEFENPRFQTFMELQAIQQFTNGNIKNTNSSRSAFQDMLSALVSGDALKGT
ncbi:hypothetical protein [Peribacillus frigoritolerans]|uniref:hypothetical protein n=1 Tax=Peribacillus frigoritolerans TaxID=450367 RepID=UPI003F508991